MTDLRQREPRVECPAFLAFVRRKPCCVCGAPAPSQAAHVRMGSPEHGKRNAGIGEKPSDRWAVPLCAGCHLDSPEAQHRVGERNFWRSAKLDPFKIAARLYAQFERRQKRTPEQRERVVGRAKRRASTRRTSPMPKKWKFRDTVRALAKRGIKVKSKWPSRPFPKGRKLRIRP